MKYSFLLLSLVFVSSQSWAMIYGTDDRVLVKDETSEVIKEQAKSIAMFIELGSEQLKNESEGKAISFPIVTLKEQLEVRNNIPVCPDFRFQEQSRVSTCTAFLVGENLAMTAGHCLRLAAKGPNEPAPFDTLSNQGPTPELKDVRLIFNHYYEANNLTNIPLKSVYKIKKIAKAKFLQGIDFALLELDRKVEGVKALVIENEIETWMTSHQIHRDTIYSLGYPFGMPLVIAKKGFIDWAFYPYFKFFLDIANGNSGSPLFNTSTNKVVGVLSGVSFASSAGDIELDSERNCIQEKHRDERALDRPMGLFTNNFFR